MIDYIQFHKDRLDENGQRLVRWYYAMANCRSDQWSGSDSSSSAGDRAPSSLQRFLHGFEMHSHHYFLRMVKGLFGVNVKPLTLFASGKVPMIYDCLRFDIYYERSLCAHTTNVAA